MHSKSHRTRVNRSPFSQQAEAADRQQLRTERYRLLKHREDEVQEVAEELREQLGATVNVGKALIEYAGVWMGRNRSKLAVPYH